MTDRIGEDTRREVRDLATQGTDIGARLDGLDSAVRVARGRLDDTLLDDVQTTVDRLAGRLRLSATHTVVAIAGATGSGKSSTYNSLVGLDLSSVGVRRPTTSWATACVWGTEGAAELLEWLGIPPRHQTMRDSMLDSTQRESGLNGAVLLDMPDHDSTEVSHHLEVDRLVDLADLLVWVLDPQKYADAALHDRYLAPYRTHGDVLLVVLNQIDTVPVAERQAMVDDVKRLLAADGLPEVKVIPLSAKDGTGMDELRLEIESRVAAKRTTSARVAADIAAAAADLADDGEVRPLPAEDVAALVDRIATAAGVDSVATTVARRTRARAARATGWPVLAPFGRLRSDPRKLSVDLGRDAPLLTGRGVEPAPAIAPVPRELVGESVRWLTDGVTQRLSGPWAEAIHRAGAATVADTTATLDDRLGKVDLRANRLPLWVRTVQLVQWTLFLLAVLGGAWWIGDLVASDHVPAAGQVGQTPMPAAMLFGGLLGGGVLALAARSALGRLSRDRAEEVEEALSAVIEEVVDTSVVQPVSTELSDYATFKAGLARAVE